MPLTELWDDRGDPLAFSGDFGDALSLSGVAQGNEKNAGLVFIFQCGYATKDKLVHSEDLERVRVPILAVKMEIPVDTKLALSALPRGTNS